MKRYEINRWDVEIKEVEVLRETANFLILPSGGRKGERREAKESYYSLYHATWEAAHECLLQRTKKEVEWAKDNLEIKINNLKIVENMRKP